MMERDRLSSSSSKRDGTWASRTTTASLAIASALSVLLASPPAFADADSAGAARTPSASDSYVEAGLWLNPFTYANPLLGVWLGHLGVHVSGSYLASDRYDMFADVGLKFVDNGRWRHAVHVIVGQTRGSDPGADYDYAYAGLAYELNFRGLFIELGLGKDFVDRLGNLEDDPVIPVGTLLGYAYQFR